MRKFMSILWALSFEIVNILAREHETSRWDSYIELSSKLSWSWTARSKLRYQNRVCLHWNLSPNFRNSFWRVKGWNTVLGNISQDFKANSDSYLTSSVSLSLSDLPLKSSATRPRHTEWERTENLTDSSSKEKGSPELGVWENQEAVDETQDKAD